MVLLTRLDLLWQKELPTEMILEVSVPLGHDSTEQSWTPFPKFMFLQRQPMSELEQPKLWALPNMLLMHVFCVAVS